MPDVSPRLDLPYLLPAQAQKHVTHNEALRLLDGITQLAVKSFGATTPPGGPTSGDMYALGLSPTGAWAGQDGKLALWSENAWMFLTPGEGWLAWGEAEAKLQVYTGGDWQSLAADLSNPDSLGINTTADMVNRLAVASDASLFTNDGGGHQLKINKATIGDTASQLYQTNWSGRAEIGLMGDDDFQFKVSPDGSSWVNAITLDKDNGRMTIAGISGRIPVYNTGNSVFIGDGAGLNDDLSANQNVFIGNNAGRNNTTGERNTGIGPSAMHSTTTGSVNTAIGYFALNQNTTGGNNTAIGAYALRFTTTGGFNTATGFTSLYSNTAGSFNTANGFYTLRSNTTGNNNTASGYTSLYLNTTGNSNTAHGFSSLYDLTTGANNTALGRSAGSGITTGDNNTIIGANVTGLDPDLQSTVILADGAGNQRLSFDSTGLMDYKQTPDVATANPTFSHYITLKLNGATYYIPAHNAAF